MALLWFTGAGPITTAAMVRQGVFDKGDGGSGVNVNGGRRGTGDHALSVGAINQDQAWQIAEGVSKVYCGFAISGSSFGNNQDLQLIKFRDLDSPDTEQGTVAEVNFDTLTGYLELRRGIGSVTSTTLVQDNIGRLWLNRGYLYFEMMVEAVESGAWEMRVNGETLASGTSDFSKPAGQINNIRFNSVSNDFWDDMYICDDSGTLNNTWLGDVVAYSIVPNGDVAGEIDFTPSTGSTNWERLDNVPPGESEYVEASTSGNRDFYDFTAPANITDVKGVRVYAWANNTRMKGAKMRLNAKRSTSVVNGVQQRLAQRTYSHYSDVFEYDPVGGPGDQWLEGDITAAQFGMELV
jgi:hypothetical protein